MSQPETSSYRHYKLINADKLAFNIDRDVSLIGLLSESETVLQCVDGENKEIPVIIKGFRDVGSFPKNTRLVEIRGTVKDAKTIEFHRGYPIPSTDKPDLVSLYQTVEDCPLLGN